MRALAAAIALIATPAAAYVPLFADAGWTVGITQDGAGKPTGCSSAHDLGDDHIIALLAPIGSDALLSFGGGMFAEAGQIAINGAALDTRRLDTATPAVAAIVGDDGLEALTLSGDANGLILFGFGTTVGYVNAPSAASIAGLIACRDSLAVPGVAP